MSTPEETMARINVEAEQPKSLATNPEISAMPSRTVTSNAPSPGRIVSLDVFRGMTIAAMILVNDPGGPSYGPLDHAEWNGWTHTDLIFPFFMFIAGTSMALSFARRLQRPVTAKNAESAKAVSGKTSLLWHTVRRGSLIFLIGLLLNLFPWFFDASRYANLRIPGVLQRIGFCYIFAGIIYLYSKGSVASDSALTLGSRDSALAPRSPGHSANPSSWIRAGIIATLLLGYWAAMKLIPVPGIGAGDLTPNNNLAAYIDNSIFTARHMWQHRPWDPEGLLSSVPALCTMLLGTFVGEMFVRRDRDSQSESTWQYKVKRLIAWGAAAVVVGEVWGIWFPINKNLWTSSYVVFTAGYAMLVLAATYWLVDVRGWRKWATPFLVFGSNAILVFALSNWLTKLLLILRVPSGRLPNGQQGSMSIWSWLIVNGWRPHFADVRNSSLAFALSYVLLWLGIMWWFYKKRIFVKI